MKTRLVVSQDGNVPLLALVFGLIRKRATEPSALVTSAAGKGVLPISINDAFAVAFETETHLLKALQTRSHNTSWPCFSISCLSEQTISTVLDPHRQGRTIISRQGVHSPS